MIVVSILLAFGIDAAWDAAQERRLEADYVGRLKSDLEADTARYAVGASTQEGL